MSSPYNRALASRPEHNALQTVESTLHVEALDVWRGEQCLFEALNFTVRPGEAALVLGPNGAGKTTLLRILAGLSLPSAGSVRWSGIPMRALPFERRAEVAYRGHLEALKKDLSVLENIEFYRALWHCGLSVEVLLSAVSLDGFPHRRVRQLSAGQKRRLALAALRAQQARLWILDEPMTNLDAAGRALVVSWVKEHIADGGSAVIATHQTEALRQIARYIVEL
jgi:heme exporter protein A